MQMSLYLYGILPGTDAYELDLLGLDDAKVQGEPVNEFLFIYSAATRPRYRTSRQNLLTHERILEALMHQGCRSMLPLQFGLVVQDWEQVKQDLIVPYHEQLSLLLHKLTGMREVGVKVYWEPQAELSELPKRHPRLQQQTTELAGKALSMDQTIALGQLIEGLLIQEQQAITAQFNQTLIPLAQETKISDLLTKEMIYNVAFLIPWETEPKFEEEVQNLDKLYGERLRIRYNNFTAPYNFAQLG